LDSYGLDETLALGAVEGLSEAVPMPCGVRAGGEADAAEGDRLAALVARERVDVDIAGEPLGGSLGGGLTR